MAEPKKIKANIKFRIAAGKATPAPPVGSLLGAQGINTMEFISAFNDQTRDMGDMKVAVSVAIAEDRSFTFTVKGEPTAELIRRTAGVQKGAGNSVKEKAGNLTRAQVEEIVATKMSDLNATTPAAAYKIIAGTARSMGISVEA